VNHTFKAELFPNFLKMIEESALGQRVSLRTGLSVASILSNVELDISSEPMVCSWFPGDLNIDICHIDLIGDLLRFAWEKTENRSNYELENQLPPDVLIKMEKGKLAGARITQRMQASTITNQKLQIKRQKKELKIVQGELNEIYEQKKQKSAKISAKARESRGCKVVKETIEKIALNPPDLHINQIFKNIRRISEGVLYIEDGKLHHNDCECNSFGLPAFYSRFQNAKKPNSI
jgi:hypothetical protein